MSSVDESIRKNIKDKLQKAFDTSKYTNKEEENKALHEFTMKQIAHFPGIHHERISMWIEGPIGGEKTMKFGNLYSALLFRGIPIDPDLTEYTDEHGTRFVLVDNDIIFSPALPIKLMQATFTLQHNPLEKESKS